jgi:uncharacterized protein
MDVIVEKKSDQDLKSLGVYSWPIWEKEVSKFDWNYDSTEECFLLEGKVILETKKGESFTFGKGDFVTFKKGLKCQWEVVEPVKKHYNFI